jgi:hypothetical protein
MQTRKVAGFAIVDFTPQHTLVLKVVQLRANSNAVVRTAHPSLKQIIEIQFLLQTTHIRLGYIVCPKTRTGNHAETIRFKSAKSCD